MTVKIINADVMDGLRSLADESVHCVVTSPPYWGLRDYGVDGQIGREATLDEHIELLVAVFREVRRVLRADGTMWFNYGDAYAGSWGAQSRGEACPQNSTLSGGQMYAAPKGTHTGSMKRTPGLKPKDLMMLPARMALALQADGWWVRKEIIWHKPNPMPESCQDRPTSAHEKIYLMTKAERYFYDADAVRERAEYFGLANQDESGFKDPRRFNGKHKDGYRSSGEIGAKGNANGFRGGSYVNGKPGPRTSVGNTKTDKQRGHSRRHAGFNERWDAMTKEEQQASRNLRDVWTIACEPFPDAHFATFPTRLAETCIKAGCPEGGVVLDPFGGSGTTGMVADRLGRDALLIELNPEYVSIARRRLARDRLARKRGTMDDVKDAALDVTPLEALMAG